MTCPRAPSHVFTPQKTKESSSEYVVIDICLIKFKFFTFFSFIADRERSFVVVVHRYRLRDSLALLYIYSEFLVGKEGRLSLLVGRGLEERCVCVCVCVCV